MASPERSSEHEPELTSSGDDPVVAARIAARRRVDELIASAGGLRDLVELASQAYEEQPLPSRGALAPQTATPEVTHRVDGAEADVDRGEITRRSVEA